MMKRYNHDLLFYGNSGTVQKAYRLPQYLVDLISAIAARHKFTNTDVVIEALLHYFAPYILEQMASEIDQSSENIEACHHDAHAKKRLVFENRRLEMIRTEFNDYFSDSIEKMLKRLNESSGETTLKDTD